MIRRSLLVTVLLGAAADRAVAQAGGFPSVFGARIEERRYPNGFQAVVAKTPPVPGRAPRVFIGLYLRYGVPSAPGIELAHLVEHIVANNAPTVVDYKVPDGMVAYGSNAMTRTDFMSFWRTVSPEGLPAMIRNRANRTAGIGRDSAVFRTQVERVAGETRRALDRIGKHGLDGSDVLPIAFLGPRRPLEEVLDTILGYRPETVYREIDRYLRPGNALLVVAGDIDIAATVAILDRDLPRYPPRAGPAALPGPRFVPYQRAIVVTDPRATSIRVGAGLPAPLRKGKDFLAYLVLDQLLLGGRAMVDDSSDVERSIESPLGRRLKASLGVTAVDDGRHEPTDPPDLAMKSPSYLKVFFEVPVGRSAADIERGTVDAFRETMTADVTDAAVIDAKARLIDYLNRLMLESDLLSLGDHIAGFTFIDGSATRLNRLAAEIDAVRPDAVRRLARSYLGPGRVRVAIVTP